jgi:lipase chaperone LimK
MLIAFRAKFTHYFAARGKSGATVAFSKSKQTQKVNKLLMEHDAI